MRNAEAHKQRMGSLDTFLVTKEAGQGDGNIVEGIVFLVYLNLLIFFVI